MTGQNSHGTMVLHPFIDLSRIKYFEDFGAISGVFCVEVRKNSVLKHGHGVQGSI